MPIQSTRGRAAVGKRAQRVAAGAAAAPCRAPAKPHGLLDHLEPLGGDLAVELEREVQPFVVHPAHRPVARAKPAEQRDDLPPRLVDDRNAGEQPHHVGGAGRQGQQPAAAVAGRIELDRPRTRAPSKRSVTVGPDAAHAGISSGATSIRARSPWWRTRRSPATPSWRR